MVRWYIAPVHQSTLITLGFCTWCSTLREYNIRHLGNNAPKSRKSEYHWNAASSSGDSSPCCEKPGASSPTGASCTVPPPSEPSMEPMRCASSNGTREEDATGCLSPATFFRFDRFARVVPSLRSSFNIARRDMSAFRRESAFS